MSDRTPRTTKKHNTKQHHRVSHTKSLGYALCASLIVVLNACQEPAPSSPALDSQTHKEAKPQDKKPPKTQGSTPASTQGTAQSTAPNAAQNATTPADSETSQNLASPAFTTQAPQAPALPTYTQQELEQIIGEQSQETLIEDGQTYKAQITYKPGTKIKHGKEILYYQNGTIAQSSYYVEGKREGLYQIFSQKGVLIYEAHYLGGKLHGLCKLFDVATGKLKSQMNFVYGLQEGEMSVYYPSGKLWHSLQYARGKKNGVAKEFDESGKILREVRYVDDVQTR